MENRLDSVFCHVLGTSRLGRGSKTCSRCDCLAGFCICKQHSAGQMTQLVSCLWHSRIWNYFMRWLCETGNSQWLWTGRFEKNTPRFSHVKSRLNLQRALGFHGFLQSSPWFVRRCCLVLVGDVVFFIFFKKSHVTMYRLSLSSIKSMLLPRPLGLCRVSNSCYKWQIATWQPRWQSDFGWDHSTLGRSGKNWRRCMLRMWMGISQNGTKLNMQQCLATSISYHKLYIVS